MTFVVVVVVVVAAAAAAAAVAAAVVVTMAVSLAILEIIIIRELITRAMSEYLRGEKT